MNRFKNILLIISTLLVASVAHAQMQRVQYAYEQVQAGKLDSAKANIDLASIHPDSKNDFQTWMVKGFVYKEIYKIKESDRINSEARRVAVESFFKSLTYPEIGENKSVIIQNIKFLASKYYNDAVKFYRDTATIKIAIDNFEEYKNINKKVDPAFVSTQIEIQFYLSLATTFLETFEATKLKTYSDFEKVFLLKVLDLDQNNFQANKNIGVLYYNLSVEIIKKMDYDVPLEELSNYQDASIKYARQAEPFMLKAHNINPDDKTVIEGLHGIYHLLNETEKSEMYKKKLQTVNDK